MERAVDCPWWDILFADARWKIIERLSPVAQHCFARTCRAAWEEHPHLPPHGLTGITDRRTARRNVAVLTRGGTPLAMVAAWVRRAEARLRAAPKNCEELTQHAGLVEALAFEGAPIAALLTFCHTILKLRWHAHEDPICDMLEGYVRGGHVALFLALWPRQHTVDMSGRRVVMFHACLFRAAAGANQAAFLLDYLPAATQAPPKVVMNAAFHAIIKSGRAPLFERFVRDYQPDAAEW